MRNLNFLLLFLFLVMIKPLVTFAQEKGNNEKEYNTYLHLKNGIKVYVELVDIIDDTVVVELPNGRQIKYLESQIRSLVQPLSEEHEVLLAEARHHWLEKKATPHFFQIRTGLLLTTVLNGYHFGLNYKYRLRGGHFGTAEIDVDVLEGSQYVISQGFTLGYEWVYFTNMASPYVSGRVGWGIGQFLGESIDPWRPISDRSIDGGYRAAIGTGLYFKSKRQTSFNIGVELFVQQMTFTYVSSGPWPGETVIDQLYRRLNLNFGFTF